MTPEERFEELVGEFLARPGVTPPDDSGKKFGSNALKVTGRIFAMLVRDELVLKLPAKRVAGLVAAGEGRPFDAGKGKPMKEWLVVASDAKADWLALTEEALAFVS